MIHAGKTIAVFRYAQNLSQRQFAERIGVKKSTQNKFEQQRSVQLETLEMIAEMFGLTLVQLLNEYGVYVDA